MTKDRLLTIINNILDWGSEHDPEFMECLVAAMKLTNEEKKELDLDSDDVQEDAVSDEDDNVTIEQKAYLKYLLNKQKCCPLDRDEICTLDELLLMYGEPDYE